MIPRCILIIALAAASSSAEELLLAVRGESSVAISCAAQTPVMRRAAASLQQFVATRALDVPARRSAVIRLETLDLATMAAALHLNLAPLRNARPEAHLLAAREYKGNPTVVIVGRSEVGVEAGAAYLLSKLIWTGRELRITLLDELRQPFISTREATLCPTGRILKKQPELMRKVNYEHWDEQHLAAYPRFLQACGFNSVQLMELIGWGDTPGYRDGGDRKLISPVLQKLAKAAHENGLSVSQYIWGSSDGLHWANAEERPRREQRYRELATTYGDMVDHLVTHWIDEGYEGGYVVPQEATAFLLQAYRQHNPRVQTTVDTWGNGEFWKGDPRAKRFLDDTFCPKEIGVALERWYDPRKAAQIRQSGRRVGIWGWYLGDYEMAFGSHLETRILDKYFSSLPAAASEAIDWLSIELCFHALPSEINLYVAGRKMWEPRRPLSEILLDYCRAVYGPQNAEAMKLVYETVEQGQKDVKTYGFFIPQSDRFPVVRGTAAFQAQVRQALAAIEKVAIPVDWQPNFATVAKPADDVVWLRDELRQMALVKERQ